MDGPAGSCPKPSGPKGGRNAFLFPHARRRPGRRIPLRRRLFSGVIPYTEHRRAAGFRKSFPISRQCAESFGGGMGRNGVGIRPTPPHARRYGRRRLKAWRGSTGHPSRPASLLKPCASSLCLALSWHALQRLCSLPVWNLCALPRCRSTWSAIVAATVWPRFRWNAHRGSTES